MGPAFASDPASLRGEFFAPHRHTASVGDPIDVPSGAYYFSTTDFSIHGRTMDLLFTRYYNSANDWYEPSGTSYLGAGWRHSYQWWVGPVQAGSPCGYQLTRGDGTVSYIDPVNDADYVSCSFQTGVNYVAVVITMRDQTVYTFADRYQYRVDPDSNVTESIYRLTRIDLPSGNHVTLSYTPNPYSSMGESTLTSITDTVGRTMTLHYNANFQITSVSDSTGRSVSYAYDGYGRMTSATDTTGWVTAYGYSDTTRHITTYTDQDGRIRATNVYNADGTVATQTDGEGYVTSRSTCGANCYDVYDPRSTHTQYTFGTAGLIQERVWANSTYYDMLYSYDAYSNLASVTDRLGHATSFTYSAIKNANLLTRTSPAVVGGSPITSYQYDSKNNLTQVTDPRGFTTSYTYDATTGAVTSQRQQMDATTYATTSFTYGDAANPGLPTAVTSPRGYSTAFVYDNSGNLVHKTDADGYLTTYAYDALGRQTSATDGENHTTSTSYDNADRVTSVTDPLGHATRYTYDHTGNRTTVSDRNNNTTTWSYDHNARLSTVTQSPAPGTTYTTTLSRDGNGNVTRTTEGNGNIHDSSYDAFNRVSSSSEYTGQATLVTSSSRDAMGNVVARTTPDGVTTTYGYDALYRVTSISAPGVAISYTYDLASNRTSMADATGTTTYVSDGAGRLTSAATPTGTVSYGYDLDDDRTSLTYPGGLTVTYNYTPAGRLSSILDWASRQSTYTYRSSGLVATLSYPNGMVATYGYDNAQRLTSLTNTIGATTITSDTYTLDPEGNRISLSEFIAGITNGTSDTFGFNYDGLERLTATTTTNAETFTLDGASNLTARTGPSKTFTVDGADRPMSDGVVAMTWSTADRLIGRGVDTFGYDALDRLTSSTVAGTARGYAYNGDGLLQSRTTGGVTTTFLWDPATSPARLLTSGSSTVVYGLGPLYSVNGTAVTTFARDGQKSVLVELAGASVSGSWRYRAYGEIAQSSGASAPSLFGYVGQLLDPSGLYYMRARWYDPAAGRFVTHDPLQQSATTSSAFAYASANPLSLTDPTGLVATTGDEDDGGACVDLACGDLYKPYSDATVDAALGATTSPIVVSNEDTVASLRPIIAAIVVGFARQSSGAPGVPLGPDGKITAEVRRQLADQFAEYGCHTCGSRDAGTQSGNPVADHQPPTALADGQPQRAYPQCLDCSNLQGSAVREFRAAGMTRVTETEFRALMQAWLRRVRLGGRE